VPVLFEAPLAASLIGNFVYAVSGGSLYRKSSFLLDSLGNAGVLAASAYQRAPAPAARPGEQPLRRRRRRHPRPRGGRGRRRAEGLLPVTYSARKLGMQTTGNAGGSHNLIVKPGKRDLVGLAAQMGRGLLVTELLGQGVNYVTGDYSRGACGYWVENGEIRYPVQEITIAGNLKDMLRGIVAVGSDVLVRGSKQVGSILVDRMTVAGA
jgi:PmbA protein